MATQWFPKILLGASVAFFDNLLNTKQRRQIASVDLLLSSFAAIGPLIPRLVARGELAASMFTVTLQRDAIQVGGNEGTLYIGELPPTVSNESLTWVPVRRYPPEQGGMEPPLDAPDEIYPIAWEIAVEEVYFDEIKLPRSQLSTSNISLSALIDTGNSLIRGPPDVVAHIQTMSGGSQFHCSTPHTLAFQIGGKLFPVDPRDFVKQVHAGDVNTCAANLAATDVPVGNGSGYLYSWNLGQPFLKGVLASFYYGSLSRPSEDPPRIGLLSTVPSDAGELLKQVVQFAEATYHDFSHVVESAPASLPPAYSTGIGGVPLAFPTLGIDEFNESSPVNSGSQVKVSAGRWRVLIGLLGWVTWEMVV
ncbi:hypothetical protein ID866_5985 [Astraeus odoratus]|nr:hypothetical protein ID866_5985 [Astraeus odoratus]